MNYIECITLVALCQPMNVGSEIEVQAIISRHYGLKSYFSG